MAESFVFVSYSHDDAVIVQKLIDSLHKHGIDVWLDQHSLQPGTPDWEEAIRVAIESCMAFILIASPSSRKSL